MSALALVATTACASAPQSPTGGFAPERFQSWSAEAPAYRVFPGDEIEVTVHTAAELSGTVAVAPDGRANLPLAGAVMVSDRTALEAARAIADAYGRVLRDPIVEVRPISFGSQRVLVGGEVGAPGIYDLPSARTGVLEAVMLAGGPTPRARRGAVVVLRRTQDGGVMMRTVDLAAALAGGPDAIPLSRHDIVFVPRSRIAEINDFVEQYVSNIIPIDDAFAFAIADQAFQDDD